MFELFNYMLIYIPIVEKKKQKKTNARFIRIIFKINFKLHIVYTDE